MKQMREVHVYVHNWPSNRKLYVLWGTGKIGFISTFHPSTHLFERREKRERERMWSPVGTSQDWRCFFCLLEDKMTYSGHKHARPKTLWWLNTLKSQINLITEKIGDRSGTSRNWCQNVSERHLWEGSGPQHLYERKLQKCQNTTKST